MPGLIVAACLLALGSALASQYWGGLQPCVLCHYQRYAYGAALAFGLVGLVGAGTPWARMLATALAALSFLAGAAIAFFHSGVERKWWRGTDGCHAPAMDLKASLDQQLKQLLDQPFVACDEIPWSLFGLSMANYNVWVSLALAAFCILAVMAMARQRS